MAWYRDYGGFPPSQAREVKGGIKSQSRRGGFGQNWWAKRWVELIESFGLGARLTRGRAYARKGQVVSIQMEKGCISAKVQGSRAKPYTVTMRVKPLEADAWATISHALRKEALFSAALLSGQMPQQIEEIAVSSSKCNTQYRIIGFLLSNLRQPLKTSILFRNRQFLSNINHNFMHLHMEPLLK